MKGKRVLIIDTANSKVVEGAVNSLEEMQKIVGGYIERAFIMPCGHEVYVNEEGLFDSSLKPFIIEGGAQPYVGNAYIIGSVTPTGNNRAATLSVEEVTKMVIFL